MDLGWEIWTGTFSKMEGFTLGLGFLFRPVAKYSTNILVPPKTSSLPFRAFLLATILTLLDLPPLGRVPSQTSHFTTLASLCWASSDR